jgi:hypothetical protein
MLLDLLAKKMKWNQDWLECYLIDDQKRYNKIVDLENVRDLINQIKGAGCN